jgi:hypothetical protein
MAPLLSDLRFSRLWKLLSPWIWCCIVWYMGTNILEELAASVQTPLPWIWRQLISLKHRYLSEILSFRTISIVRKLNISESYTPSSESYSNYRYLSIHLHIITSQTTVMFIGCTVHCSTWFIKLWVSNPSAREGVTTCSKGSCWILGNYLKYSCVHAQMLEDLT